MKTLVAGAVVALAATSAHAATLRVCASGCAYASVQAAINAATPGDTILLRAGETFVENVTLRAKSSSSTAFITIRSDASDAVLPAAGVRLVPQGRLGANTARAALARLLGRGGTWKSTPVVRTEVGAHHYRLQFLEIDGTANLGYETLVEIGNNSSQTAASMAPWSIVLDRVYLHGHATRGQKRGVALNGRACDIIDSYISDIKSFSDSQAIAAFNGPGPFTIRNNYLEAAAENILFGGDDPKIPDLIPSDVTISRNHFTKPLAWRSPILTAPARPWVTGTTSGSLASGTHYFKVVAVMSAGGGSAVSAPSTELAVTVGAARAVTLAWGAVPNADRYRIYRGTSAGAQAVYLETSANLTSFTYTGSAERSGTPKSSGTRWTVKNLLELKNAQRVTITGNLLEYNWDGFQQGYAVVFTPRNQSGGAPWVAVRDITFSYNLVRHSGAGINILGRDYVAPSQQTRRIRIVHNIFADIDSAWGNTGRFLVLTGGPAEITVDHNTIFHASLLVDVAGPAVPGFVFTNNLAKHNTYGVKGQNRATGTDTLNGYFPGYVFTRNVLAGGRSSLYPAGNLFPSVTDFLAQFVNVAAGDYRLVSSSPWRAGGTDGKDLGADVRAVEAARGGTLDSPDTTSPAPAPPPSGGPTPPDGGTTNSAPVAEASGPYAATAGAAVVLDGSASRDAEAPLVRYDWQLGDEILIRAADVPAASLRGNWQRSAVSGAAGGVALVNPNKGEPKRTSPLAAPASYVDITFEAGAGVPYMLWMRMRAENDYYGNDSVFVQFSGSVTASGTPIYRIGTTSGESVVLEQGAGAGVFGWGWADTEYSAALGTPIYFATSGRQTIRLQPREDGVMIDQIVLSSVTYATAAPGLRKSDTTIISSALGRDAGITAAHTYRKRGTYPVTLTVTDAGGLKASDRATVTVR